MGPRMPASAQRAEPRNGRCSRWMGDFADIRTYPPADYLAIVVLRPRRPNREAVLHMLGRALRVLQQEWTPHRLWIIEPDRIRVWGSNESDE